MISSSGAKVLRHVLDRLERVVVADRPARLEADAADRGERRVEARLRGRARRVLLVDPVPDRRVQRRADDEDPASRLPSARLRIAESSALAADRLVRDHEDPLLTGRMRRRRLRHRRLVAGRA